MSAVINENSKSDPNKHVREYLSYYLSLSQAPQFAVLINGQWGVGKTFLVKDFLKTKFENQSDFAYISLFGVKNSDDLDAALLHAIYPILGSKSAQMVGRLGKAALKFFNVDFDVKPADVPLNHNARVYVFDDMERCAMPIGEVLGYINEFVEGSACKVIVIANESEIDSRKEYGRKREKIFGKILDSGLIDHNQKMTVAAMQMADMKVCAHRS